MTGRHHPRLWACAFILVTAPAVPGCWGSGDSLPREAVWGIVTLDGKPVASGSIRFNPTAADTTGAAVEGGSAIRDGQFSIPVEVGLIPGNYRVAISAGKRPDAKSKGDAGAPGTPEAPGGGLVLAREMIPEKYNARSTLKAEVKADHRNELTFELRSK